MANFRLLFGVLSSHQCHLKPNHLLPPSQSQHLAKSHQPRRSDTSINSCPFLYYPAAFPNKAEFSGELLLCVAPFLSSTIEELVHKALTEVKKCLHMAHGEVHLFRFGFLAVWQLSSFEFLQKLTLRNTFKCKVILGRQRKHYQGRQVSPEEGRQPVRGMLSSQLPQ